MTEKVEAMPPEQAADLAALEAAAQAAEPAQVAQAAQEPQAGRPDLAEELRALVLLFVGMAAPILPSLVRIYTPEATATAAQAVAAVCNKRGWMQDGLMGEWGEEIAAAAILGPLAFATYHGVRADLEAGKKTPGALAAPSAEPAPVEGSGQFGVGAVVPSEGAA